MTLSSQYYFLNDNFLLEYKYNTDLINTSDKSFRLLENNHTDENYLYSDNNFFPENVNIIDKSFTNIDKVSPKYVYLDQDLVTPWNDYDAELTSNGNLDMSFVTNYDVQYDTLRLYFRSGYNLEDIEGIYLNIKFRLTDNKFVNIANLTYLKYDSYKEFLPNTFLLGEGTFNSYIDIKIPSLESLKTENTNFPSDTDKLWHKLSSGSGIHNDGNVIIDFGVIDRKYTETISINPTTDVEYSFFDLIQETKFSINSIDGYANVHASILETDDYFEFQAKYNGNAISDYITLLNQEINSEWIILHDIIVFEQLGTDNIQSSIYSFVQENDYDDPLLFRPVLKYSENSVSYTINYTIRLYNRITNEQITKTSQFISNEVKKYGKKLSKINLGYIPTIDKIYNEVKTSSTNNFTPKINERVFNRERFAINYFDNTNIAININNNEKLIEFNSKSIFHQYEALIVLNDLDNYFKFNVYEFKEDSYQDKNLVGTGDIYITFIDDNNKEVKIKQSFDEQFDPAKGEIIFKLPNTTIQKIIQFKNSNFYIIVKTENSESILYTGNWVYSKEKSKENVIKQNLIKDEEIKKLKLEIDEYKKSIEDLNITITEANNKVKEKELLLQNKGRKNIKNINNLLDLTKIKDQKSIDRKLIEPKKGIYLKDFKIIK